MRRSNVDVLNHKLFPSLFTMLTKPLYSI